MENKYYTPSIEEFHVGFEFETSYLEDYDTWKKVTLEFDDFGFYTSTWEVDSNPTEFRVKYLDKEDIESLGWTDGETHGLSGYVLNYATDDSYQMYYDKDNQFTQIYNWNSKIIFEGIIKNKSELKRLLKQLGINGQD